MTKVGDPPGSKLSHSALIEAVLGSYFGDRARRKVHSRNFKRINAAADRLDAEAVEVLEYQATSE